MSIYNKFLLLSSDRRVFFTPIQLKQGRVVVGANSTLVKQGLQLKWTSL